MLMFCLLSSHHSKKTNVGLIRWINYYEYLKLNVRLLKSQSDQVEVVHGSINQRTWWITPCFGRWCHSHWWCCCVRVSRSFSHSSHLTWLPIDWSVMSSQCGRWWWTVTVTSWWWVGVKLMTDKHLSQSEPREAGQWQQHSRSQRSWGACFNYIQLKERLCDAGPSSVPTSVCTQFWSTEGAGGSFSLQMFSVQHRSPDECVPKVIHTLCGFFLTLKMIISHKSDIKYEKKRLKISAPKPYKCLMFRCWCWTLQLIHCTFLHDNSQNGQDSSSGDP